MKLVDRGVTLEGEGEHLVATQIGRNQTAQGVPGGGQGQHRARPLGDQPQPGEGRDRANRPLQVSRSVGRVVEVVRDHEVVDVLVDREAFGVAPGPGQLGGRGIDLPGDALVRRGPSLESPVAALSGQLVAGLAMPASVAAPPPFDVANALDPVQLDRRYAGDLVALVAALEVP